MRIACALSMSRATSVHKSVLSDRSILFVFVHRPSRHPSRNPVTATLLRPSRHRRQTHLAKLSSLSSYSCRCHVPASISPSSSHTILSLPRCCVHLGTAGIHIWQLRSLSSACVRLTVAVSVAISVNEGAAETFVSEADMFCVAAWGTSLHRA